MDRLLVCRVVLQVLALAAVVPTAKAEPTLGYSIENGQLNSPAAKERVVAKLSNGPEQESWWQLGEVHRNTLALEQFFAGGLDQADVPPGGKMSSTDLFDSLKKSATAVYTMSKSITGIGRIDACLWTLIFQCIDPACSQGMVPLVAVPGSSATESEYVYAPLLLPVTASLLVEAIPSSTALLPDANPVVSNATQFRTHDITDSALSLTINVRRNLPSCSHAAVLNCRSSLLDSAYGLLPGFSCVQFERKNKPTTFRLLVSEASTVLLNGSNPSFDTDEIVSEFLYDNVSSTWKNLPIQECYDEPLVLVQLVQHDEKKYYDEGGYGWIVWACYNESCLYFRDGNVSCGSSLSELGRPRELEVPEMVHALFKSCVDGHNISLHEYDTNGLPVTCQLSENRVCNVTIYVDGASDPQFLVFSRLTNWSSTTDFTPLSTDGAEPPLPCIPSLSEFLPAKTGSSCCGHVSLLWQSPYGNNGVDGRETGEASQAILIRATAYLRSYIAEHNVAFTTANGLATDLYTFVALIVSTAISVILAVPWPFTSYLLKQISKRCPHYLCSPKHHRLSRRRVAKMSLHAICNTILSLVFFLPVLSIAINELQRGQPFYTWDLGSSDLAVALDSSRDSNTQKLRVVYLFSATSKYSSHFLGAITSVVSLTCFIVVLCTIKRCMQIFSRFDLLERMENRLIEMSMDTELMHAQSNNEARAELVQRAFKAIEMSDSKYLCITKKVNASS